MANPKMHEIIAAEPSVTAAFNSMREETAKVFDKPAMFVKTSTVKTFFDAEDAKLNTTEVTDITTTVIDRLKYLLEGSFTKYLDLQLQKDATNQVAKADLVVGGQSIAFGLPATMLLQLEKELAALRQLILKAPTLQPGPVWIRDENEGLFVTQEPKVTFHTRKTIKPVILVPATKEHPAQVDKVSEDVTIAKSEQKIWSGTLTSTQKHEILARVDALLVGAKKARQRANSVDVVKSKVGKTIANYILNGPAEVADDE